jgi:hypothetical protein
VIAGVLLTASPGGGYAVGALKRPPITLRRALYLFAAVLVSASTPFTAAADDIPEPPFDWRSDWEVPKSFDLRIDTTGYTLPAAIAFVPRPGPDPKDPLYFVAELRGVIKVVTNDRTVSDFASVPAFDPEFELPDYEAEAGLAGICLDPAHGYLFVTFTATDPDGLLRNRIIRFDTQPGTFLRRPDSMTEIAPVLSLERSSASHQIGGCEVDGDALYVSLGDGKQAVMSKRVDRLLGKVVRMTLDGTPHPGNPFIASAGRDAAAAYVWASGLRNPFGLELVNGQLFVVDNGREIDRFLQIQPGKDYLWDGTDLSIGAAGCIVVFRKFAGRGGGPS